MADFRSNRNVLFSCKYHVVFCPKYRKPVLNPPIEALKKLIRQVCDETRSALIEMEVVPDHVHLLVGCDPQYGIHRMPCRHVDGDLEKDSLGVGCFLHDGAITN
jgi:putative transposase